MRTYRIAVVVAVAVLVCPGVLGQKILDLEGQDVTDEQLGERLKGLSNLEVLDLESTKVTDAGLEHLKGLSKLEELYLDGTKVTDAGVQRLKEALPDCRIRH